MTLTLAIDCETSGLVKKGLALEDESQPHIVELAAMMFDDAGQVVNQIQAVVYPDGWTIEDEATKLHGITTAYARAVGMPIKNVLLGFMPYVEKVQTIVAHNIQFDRGMITGEIRRLNGIGGWWTQRHQDMRCTMQLSTPVLKLPGKYNDYKYPKLEEAHVALVGPFISDHRATGDAMAALRIWRALQAGGAT